MPEIKIMVIWILAAIIAVRIFQNDFVVKKSTKSLFYSISRLVHVTYTNSDGRQPKKRVLSDSTFVHNICTDVYTRSFGPDAYEMLVFLVELWPVHSTNWRFFLHDTGREGSLTCVMFLGSEDRLCGYEGKLY